MNTYYRIDIYMYGKSVGNSEDDYSLFNAEHKRFNTLDEIRAYLNEQYGTCKREPLTFMQLDDTVEQRGYVYCFDNADWSHSPVEKWQQKDEVFINEVNDSIVLLTEKTLPNRSDYNDIMDELDKRLLIESDLIE